MAGQAELYSKLEGLMVQFEISPLPSSRLLCAQCPAIAFLCSEFKEERCHGDGYLGVRGLVWAELDSWWTESAVPGIPHMFGVCVFGSGE
ncbi:hypothetical protein SRHO_G00082290 [Serrasalmus rhombeus]